MGLKQKAPSEEGAFDAAGSRIDDPEDYFEDLPWDDLPAWPDCCPCCPFSEDERDEDDELWLDERLELPCSWP